MLDVTELESTTLEGDPMHVRPIGGFVLIARLIVLPKPLAAATTILEVTGVPAGTARVAGAIEREKSCTV
ncbi:MAG TPA: hypothetical protein VE177_07880 [Candidatus Binatus sp.]|nr:hypothetical protein [Candidatus Binatus sp.]